MELKTIKEFAHKGNLGEGLAYSNGVFKTNLDSKFNTINNKITEINNTLNKVYKVKGSTTVSGINSMTVGNAMLGNVYNLTDSGVITNGIGGELNVVKGDNVVYTENGWDQFAASLDLDQCAGQNISIEDNVISALGYSYDSSSESFATGKYITASGVNSHAEGGYTTTFNDYEHAQGVYNKSNTGETEDTKTIHSIGIGTSEETRKNAQEVMQNGDFYVINVGGYDGTNINDEGVKTLQKVLEAISDESSYIAGDNISVEGNKISALGYVYDEENKSFATHSCTASGERAHAECSNAVASGYAAHAEGNWTEAGGDASHTEGYMTKTKNSCEHALGLYNVSNNGATADEFTLHSIGIGTSDTDRKNAHEVMLNGDTFIIDIGNYDGTNPYEAQTLQEVINNKVDKEDNKGLSTEDYTTEEKTKLNSIEEGAEVNIQSDWNLSDETLKDYIKNKPDLTIYLLKEEGKSLTSNDYTTEEKDKLSGIETGAQVNTVNSVNSQTGDVVIELLTAGNNINIENNVISAKGYSTDTTNYTFATGYDTNAIDVYTHAEGFGTIAQGSAAHAEGCKTVTTNTYEHAQGSYNLSNTGENQSDKTLHSIGIGVGDYDRKNAQEVMLNGDHYIIGIGGYDGTNPGEAKTILEVITEILSKLS